MKKIKIEKDQLFIDNKLERPLSSVAVYYCELHENCELLNKDDGYKVFATKGSCWQGVPLEETKTCRSGDKLEIWTGWKRVFHRKNSDKYITLAIVNTKLPLSDQWMFQSSRESNNSDKYIILDENLDQYIAFNVTLTFNYHIDKGMAQYILQILPERNKTCYAPRSVFVSGRKTDLFILTDDSVNDLELKKAKLKLKYVIERELQKYSLKESPAKTTISAVKDSLTGPQILNHCNESLKQLGLVIDEIDCTIVPLDDNILGEVLKEKNELIKEQKQASTQKQRKEVKSDLDRHRDRIDEETKRILVDEQGQTELTAERIKGQLALLSAQTQLEVIKTIPPDLKLAQAIAENPELFIQVLKQLPSQGGGIFRSQQSQNDALQSLRRIASGMLQGQDQNLLSN
jgi:hypothetical protein